MPKKLLGPVSPGEILLEEFLVPLNVSQNRRDLDVNVARVSEIVKGKREVWPDVEPRVRKRTAA